MFIKLVKHELRASFRALIPVYGGLLLMALMARGSVWLIQNEINTATNVLAVMMIVLFGLSCLASLVLAAVLMMVRFARSVHGDEGYLTNTLPVGVHAILLSRLVIAFAAIVLTMGVVYVGVRIVLLGVEGVEEVDAIFSEAFRMLQIDSGRFLIWTAASGAVSLLSSILMVFAAISIGHSFNTGKVGKSVLFYFVLYAAAQTVSTVVTVVLTVVDSGGLIFQEAEPSLATVGSTMMLFTICMNLIFCAVYYLITWLMMKKHLNLA